MSTGTLTDRGWGSADMRARAAWSLTLSDGERRSLRDGALGDDAQSAGAAHDKVKRFVDESVASLGLALVANAVDTTLAQDEVRGTLAHLLRDYGELIPQTPHGHIFEVLRDKDGDSARDLGFHTDSSDVLALLSVKPALGGGGETKLASVRRVYDVIKGERPDLLALLEDDWHFDRRGRPGPQMVTRPIFFHDNDGTVGCYHSPRTARATPGLNGWELSALQHEALDLLDEVLVRPEVEYKLAMRGGDLLVVLNSRILHGRAAYADLGGPDDARQMLRVWLTMHGATFGSRR